MNYLLINSNESDSFAALYNNGKMTVSKASDFANPNEIKKAPDKLINCLNYLTNAVNWSGIDAISVTIGPGSFTGIRVGLALAKGIAKGLGKKIIQIDNFTLSLNRVEKLTAKKKYCVILSAGIGEYYYAIFQNNKKMSQGVIEVGRLSNLLDMDTIVVGYFDDETLIKHPYFENIKKSKSEVDSMLELTLKKFQNKEFSTPQDIEPLYLKDFVTNKSKVKNGVV